MAANKKPSKKYRPKPVARNATNLVINGLRRFTEDEIERAQGIDRHALHELVHEHGDSRLWNKLTASLNLALVLAEPTRLGGIGTDYWSELRAAQTAMVNIAVRWKNWSKWQVSDVERKLLERALDIHVAQIRAATVRNIELAQAEVDRRVVDPNRKIDVADAKGKIVPLEAPEEELA